jgi:stearoyl-CoA desaturase (delta-9 desaturase)
MKKVFAPTHKKVKNLQWFLHLSVFPAIYFSTFNYWLIALITFWLMHGVGSAIGAHRYYTHRTFKTNKFWEILMSFFFTISTTGSTIGYTMMHLKHHAHSDKDQDPHNPKLGFWKTWWGMYEESKLMFGSKVYVRLMQDPIMKFFHNYYFAIIICYVLILSIIDPILIIYAYAIPAVMQFQINAILIVLVHSDIAPKLGGYRGYDTNDNSYNIWWLKPLTLGEELHNNHHGKPASITMARSNSWKEFDPLYYFIKYVIRGNPN